MTEAPTVVKRASPISLNFEGLGFLFLDTAPIPMRLVKGCGSSTLLGFHVIRGYPELRWYSVSSQRSTIVTIRQLASWNCTEPSAGPEESPVNRRFWRNPVKDACCIFFFSSSLKSKSGLSQSSRIPLPNRSGGGALLFRAASSSCQHCNPKKLKPNSDSFHTCNGKRPDTIGHLVTGLGGSAYSVSLLDTPFKH